MKHLAIITLAALLAACGGGDVNVYPAAEAAEPAPATATPAPVATVTTPPVTVVVHRTWKDKQ